MAEFGRLVITDKGSGLAMKALTGDAAVRFTKIAASSRQYPEEGLAQLAALEDIRQQCGVSEVGAKGEATAGVRGVMPNTDLEEGYYIRTVGLYADDPDEGEILYGVSAELSEGGCYVPPYKHQTVSSLYFNLCVSVGSSHSVELRVDPGAVATVGLLDSARREIMEAAYRQAAGYTDQKVADLIGGAPGTLDTLGEIAQAVQDNEDIVKALNEAVGKKVGTAEFDSHKNTVDALLGNTDISGIGDGTVTGAVGRLDAEAVRSSAIRRIAAVSVLPADAASHPDTLYIMAG